MTMTERLNHYVKCGKENFALVTETGGTVIRGNKETVQHYIDTKNTDTLYLYVQ